MSSVVAGFLTPCLMFAVVFALHLVLPARRATGYARDPQTGEALTYRLNGLLTFVVCIAAWCAACASGMLPWDWLWQQRWSGAAGACALGLVLTAIAVLPAPGRGGSLLAELYLGRLDNPQYVRRRADAKMALYLAGAIVLELNLLSFAAHHLLSYPGDPSPGVVLHVVLLTWFVCDYLVFERVHLYTYDLVAERLGFKLVWGCLAWYPYFYAVGLWAVADLPNPQAPVWLGVVSTVLFLAGWCLARGSNLQKFAFKRDPERPFLGRAQRSLTDRRHRLLAGGFWGMARHVNYLGEILMASGIALSLGWPLEVGPWLYPLYYVILLGLRERDDDRRCAAKYGDLWQRYRTAVRWRIVPCIY